MPNILVVSRNR